MTGTKWKCRMMAGLLAGSTLLLMSCGSSASGTSGSTAVTTEAGTAASESSGAAETAESGGSGAVTNLPKIDMSKWQYNKEDDVWYQLNLQYAENSPDESYDSLAIFVPGSFMSGTDNGDGTYTCAINREAEVNGYTAETAPIVVPVNTPGYAAQEELTEYTDVSDYTDAGFVYVHIGARGRDAGAPSGVVDFKAGIRYVRYNEDLLAGNTDRIFVFGMSGGGAQSAVLGASGDSSLYTPYLEEIGAVEGVSDAVLGSMDWCPITNLDWGDEAYEWNLGATRTGLSEEEQQISDALAESYASYINKAGFKDEDGNVLTLEESESGIYQAGSYYEYIKGIVEESLNNFLSDTTFPYNADEDTNSFQAGMGTPGAGDGNVMNSMNNSEQNDKIQRNATSSGITLSGTYETAQDYIDALNADGTWVSYDAAANTAKITSVEAFTKALKNASKGLAAFDQLDASQGENTLFGYGDGSGAHFDATLAQILKDLGSGYADAYASDLARTDSVGNTVETRVQMYTPLYYLLPSEGGYQSASVAKYWRIRTGINQGDTALSTEVNLKLALENYDGVKDVDFATVWGLGHTMAERTGDSTINFISWVNDCLTKE